MVVENVATSTTSPRQKNIPNESENHNKAGPQSIERRVIDLDFFMVSAGLLMADCEDGTSE